MNSKPALPLHTLVAATHTPFASNGGLRLDMVEKQAAHLLRNGVNTVFIGGTTGESHSLTLEERRSLAQRWFDVTRDLPMGVVVHVGSNCLSDACALAAQAEKIGALAISALAPSYFKPSTIGALVEWCSAIASAAPSVPFYFYDIPSLTGVSLSMPEFLDVAGEKIPTFKGLKYTNTDLISYQLCLDKQQGRFDLPWGVDECLLAALALGAKGAVGSTYNFAAPIYLRLIEAFRRGDYVAARREQLRSVMLVKTVARRGYMASAKAVMALLGIDVGPARPPHSQLSSEDVRSLREELETLGFFQWTEPEG